MKKLIFLMLTLIVIPLFACNADSFDEYEGYKIVRVYDTNNEPSYSAFNIISDKKTAFEFGLQDSDFELDNIFTTNFIIQYYENLSGSYLTGRMINSVKIGEAKAVIKCSYNWGSEWITEDVVIVNTFIVIPQVNIKEIEIITTDRGFPPSALNRQVTKILTRLNNPTNVISYIVKTNQSIDGPLFIGTYERYIEIGYDFGLDESVFLDQSVIIFTYRALSIEEDPVFSFDIKETQLIDRIDLKIAEEEAGKVRNTVVCFVPKQKFTSLEYYFNVSYDFYVDAKDIDPIHRVLIFLRQGYVDELDERLDKIVKKIFGSVDYFSYNNPNGLLEVGIDDVSLSYSEIVELIYAVLSTNDVLKIEIGVGNMCGYSYKKIVVNSADNYYPLKRISTYEEFREYIDERLKRIDKKEINSFQGKSGLNYLEIIKLNEIIDETYFIENDILLVSLLTPSGSIWGFLEGLDISDNRIDIHLKEISPMIGTCDMSAWSCFVLVPKGDYEIYYNVEYVSNWSYLFRTI